MKNLYELYIENGCKYGFCVRRNSWADYRKAKVIKIEGVIDGQMINGDPPYFTAPYPKGHPKHGKICYHREVTLVADWIDGGKLVTTSGGTFAWQIVD